MTSSTGSMRARCSRAALSFAISAAIALVLSVATPAVAPAQGAGGSFTLEQILSYPYTEELTASDSGARIAWVFNRAGVRNIWAAEGPDYKARQITDYRTDDGQELTHLSITNDGKYIVYVHGGDHDANWPLDHEPNPALSTTQPKVEIYVVPFAHGNDKKAPQLLAEGDEPIVSPRGDRVVYLRDHQLWIARADSAGSGKRLFFARGESSSPVWSPSGDKLAFVTTRDDHSFVGIFSSDSAPIVYLAPSTSFDGSPHWSPDGKRLVFVRQPGNGGAPETLLELHPQRWELWTADATSGIGRRIWKAPYTLLGTAPSTQGEANLSWSTLGRIVFMNSIDGWQHLYSIPDSGGTPMLLTPGKFMVEYVTPSPDGRTIIYNANTGTTSGDIDRRHLYSVPVDRATPTAITSGEGLEWTPQLTDGGRTVAFVGAGAQRPPLPMVVAVRGGTPRVLGEEVVPSTFPTSQLVIPKPVVFHAADGIEVHGQLFARDDGKPGAKKPGIVFVHGGPPRQMMLGWHYMNYYSNAYAVNQYLANHGYVVLAVNYRLGVGYGERFHNPAHAGPAGASEYKDVQAGAKYLRALAAVDTARIGIWGGSYGGYLTALALARNSDVFKAGVDMHGVHDWIDDIGASFTKAKLRYEQGDIKRALDVAWASSPVASMATWKSPVLLIQGDDDRNVSFHATVDIARRLDAKGVSYEELVIPDEIHGFLRHKSWFMADSATVAYFNKKFDVHTAP
ncbi:MAG: prolyl oligopeptidase family serine peptidase [Gemmatimonadaceae bacterium]